MDEIKSRITAFLRWTEKYTKTDMVYVTTSGFWTLVAQIAASGTAFVLAIIFARLLTKDVYGIYRYLISIASIIWAFSLTGLGTAVIRAAARNEEGSLRTAFKENMRFSWIMLIFSFGGSLYYFIQDNRILAAGFLIIGVLSPFFTSFNLYSSLLLGKKRFDQIAWLSSAITIGTGVLVAIVTFFIRDPLPIIFAYMIGQTLLTWWAYKKTVRNIPKDSKVDKETLIRDGRHMSLMNVLSTVAAHIDKVFVFQMLGAAELAIYTFAIAMPEQIKGLLKNFSRIAFPKFVINTVESIKNTLPPKMTRFILLSAFGAFVYILIAPWVFRFLFPAYEASIPFSILYAISIPAVGSSVTVSALQAHSKNKELYIYTLTTSIFQIVSNAIGIIGWGIIGAITAGIINRYVTFALSSILLFRAKDENPNP